MNIMLDLETMGNGNRAAIIAIGAVSFDSGGIIDRFYRQVSLQSSVDIGMEMDASTVLWWMKQSDEARAAFRGNENADHIAIALQDFAKWCESVCENIDDLSVWGNGAAFDNTILSSAYRLAGIRQPWMFWGDKCYRTIKAMHPDILLERTGTHHNAVDDAESQANHLIKMIF